MDNLCCGLGLGLENVYDRVKRLVCGKKSVTLWKRERS